MIHGIEMRRSITALLITFFHAFAALAALVGGGVVH